MIPRCLLISPKTLSNAIPVVKGIHGGEGKDMLSSFKRQRDRGSTRFPFDNPGALAVGERGPGQGESVWGRLGSLPNGSTSRADLHAPRLTSGTVLIGKNTSHQRVCLLSSRVTKTGAFVIDTAAAFRYAAASDLLAFLPAIQGVLCGNRITSRRLRSSSLTP